jgi:hypothetical protein
MPLVLRKKLNEAGMVSKSFEQSLESHFTRVMQPKILPFVFKMTVTVTHTVIITVRVFA